MEVQAVKIQIKEKWSELDNKEVMKVLKHLHKSERLKALLLLSDVELIEFKLYPEYMQHQMLWLINDFNQKEFDHAGFNRFGSFGFIAQDMSDITAWQWLQAEELMKDLAKSKVNIIKLNIYYELIATLGIIKNVSTQDQNHAKKRINLVKKLSNTKKDYIFRRYLYLKTKVYQLLKSNEMINDEEESGESWGWSGIFQDVAERQVFGNLQELYQVPFIDVLSYLLRTKIKNDQLIREQERQRAILEAKQMN